VEPGANRTIRDHMALSDPDQATRKAGTLPAALRETTAHAAGAYDAAKVVAKLRPRPGPPETRRRHLCQPAMSGNERGRTLMRSMQSCIAPRAAATLTPVTSAKASP
jgi:hypothetical protein